MTDLLNFSDLWAAIAIAIILEGLLPFISPRAWRETIAKIAILPESQIRYFGLAAIIVGLALLTMVRS